MKGPAPAADFGSYRTLVERHAAHLRSADLLREDLFIDNSWVPATGGERLEETDPATGMVLAYAASASAQDVAGEIALADSATCDAGRMVPFGEGLEFGVVGVNTCAISYEGAPFGGMQQSGIGREGSHHGLAEFLGLKCLCVDGIG